MELLGFEFYLIITVIRIVLTFKRFKMLIVLLTQIYFITPQEIISVAPNCVKNISKSIFDYYKIMNVIN